MNSNFKILYIIGAGRSGTTLLDIVIGNSNNFFSAGELNRFTKRDGFPHDPRDNEVKDFWSKVNEQLYNNHLKNPRAYYDVFNQFEYHNNFFRIFASLRSKHYQTYSHYQQQLFSAIYKTSRHDKELTIIDSSKYPIRGFFLAKIFGDRVSLLYVKRQPSSTVESFQKKDVEQPSKGRLSTHIYLLMVNLIANRVLQLVKHSNKISIISYEQFVQSPLKTLEEIERDLQVDLSISKEIVRTDRAFTVGPLFDGNRLRLAPEIKFNKHSGGTDKQNHLLNRLFLPLHRWIWYKT